MYNTSRHTHKNERFFFLVLYCIRNIFLILDFIPTWKCGWGLPVWQNVNSANTRIIQYIYIKARWSLCWLYCIAGLTSWFCIFISTYNLVIMLWFLHNLGPTICTVVRTCCWRMWSWERRSPVTRPWRRTCSWWWCVWSSASHSFWLANLAPQNPWPRPSWQTPCRETGPVGISSKHWRRWAQCWWYWPPWWLRLVSWWWRLLQWEW